jgi:hypothetical protein
MSSIKDKIHDMVMEKEDAPRPAPPRAALSATPTYEAAQHAVILEKPSGAMYDRLKAKTDFDQTPIGKLLQEYLEPLASLPGDEGMKFKAAVLQAGKHGGLDPASILAAFDDLKATLEQEQRKFTQSSQAFDAHIDANKQNLAQLQQEITDLSKQITDESGRSASGKQEFSLAFQQRTNELEQQRARYAALLAK